MDNNTPISQASDIKVVQINLHRAKASSSNLIQYIYDNKLDIALISEPWCNNGKICGLNGLKLHYMSCDRPRAAVAYNSDLKVWPMNEFTSPDVSTVNFEGKDSNVILCSTYMDRNLNEIPETLRKLVDHCKQNNCKLIISSNCTLIP